jgi:hypothetical protein
MRVGVGVNETTTATVLPDRTRSTHAYTEDWGERIAIFERDSRSDAAESGTSTSTIANAGLCSLRCFISAPCRLKTMSLATRSGRWSASCAGYEAVFSGGLDRAEDRELPPVPEYPAERDRRRLTGALHIGLPI